MADKEKLKEKEVVSEVPPQTTTETATETVNSPITEKSPPGVSSEESALEEMDESTVSKTTEKIPGEEAGSEQTGNVEEKLKGYVQRFFPDADVSTPEKLMSSLLPLVESTVSLHDDLYEVVEEFPEFGDFIIGLRKGYTPQQAIAMYFDPESLTPPEGAEDAEAVNKAREQRRKAVGERKDKQKHLEGNKEVTAKNLISIKDELGLTDEQTMQVGKMAGEIFQDFLDDGLVKPENWKKLANGLRHEEVLSQKDKEKEEAIEDAKIAGRNEGIEKKRANKEKGDGLPKLTNTGGVKEKVSDEDKFTSDLRKATNKKRIL
jgi:hypothetical protein